MIVFETVQTKAPTLRNIIFLVWKIDIELIFQSHAEEVGSGKGKGKGKGQPCTGNEAVRSIGRVEV